MQVHAISCTNLCRVQLRLHETLCARKKTCGCQTRKFKFLARVTGVLVM